MSWLRRLWRRFVRSQLGGKKRLAEVEASLKRRQYELDKYYYDYVSGERRGPSVMHRLQHAVFTQRLFRTRCRLKRLQKGKP